MTTDDKFLELALKRFKLAVDAEADMRQRGLEELEFRVGVQWPPEMVQQRRLDGRPALVINRIPQFIRQVTNEQRQSPASVQVNPVDSGADVETAEVIQGLTRHIEVSSDASVAYGRAFESAVTIGFGYFRIITEYCDEDSFEQDIVIKQIENPFTVYMDPYAMEPDRRDSEWAFIVDDMSRDEFEARYPKAEAVNSGMSFSTIGDDARAWFTQDSVRIAEYWYVETKPDTLLQLEDGNKVFKSQVPADQMDAVMPFVVRERRVERRVIRMAKINGVEVLERSEWAGKYIPIIPVFGEEVNVNGKRHYIGMVRNAMDPSRRYNFMVSAETEAIAMAPKTPFIGAEGQFEGREQQWASLNQRNLAYIEYKPKSLGGMLAPAPQRQSYEAPIQAIMMAIRQADNDVKATMGIYDASLGEAGPQQSGRAILARQRESDVANSNFASNLARSIKHAGRIMVDLIPYHYDTARVIRLLKPDNTQEQVGINQPTMKNGKEVIYDLTAGKYDVTISVGPTYQTQRQEAAASMIDLTKSYPPIMQVAGDLLVRSMDWPGAAQIADRLKKMLPPELQDVQEGAEPEMSPQHQAAMAAMQQQNQQLTQALDAASEEIRTKRIETESKERIATLNAQVKMLDTQARLSSQEGMAMLNAEIQAVNQRLGQLMSLPDDPVNGQPGPAVG